MNIEYLVSKLKYYPEEGSPETGFFKHRVKPLTSNKEWAGNNHNKGYRCIQLNGKSYQEHRLVFLMEKGYLPGMIDHIDGNKKNNRIANLREVTNAQNGHNRGKPKNNTSGYKGITISKGKNPKYIANLRVNRQRMYLGSYITLQEAIDAYNRASLEHVGPYSKLVSAEVLEKK